MEITRIQDFSYHSPSQLNLTNSISNSPFSNNTKVTLVSTLYLFYHFHWKLERKLQESVKTQHCNKTQADVDIVAQFQGDFYVFL